MKPGMIRLPEPKKSAWEGGIKNVPVTFAYPYFKTGMGAYTHRVRTAITHVNKAKGQNSHVSLSAWCGVVGFLSEKPRARNANQFAEVPEHAILCATCEGRAIGAGMDGTREINSRSVIFSPRKTNQ